MAIANPKDSFMHYPHDKLIGIIDNEEDLNNAINQLSESGFKNEDVEYFFGADGLESLDAYAENQPFVTRLLKKLQITMLREAEEGIAKTVEALENGSYFITIVAKDEETKNNALSILKSNKAYSMFYFYTGTVEQF